MSLKCNIHTVITVKLETFVSVYIHNLSMTLYKPNTLYSTW